MSQIIDFFKITIGSCEFMQLAIDDDSVRFYNNKCHCFLQTNTSLQLVFAYLTKINDQDVFIICYRDPLHNYVDICFMFYVIQ